MKVNSLLAKTALAAAIAGASFTAAAGTLSIATPSVVAVELFGEAKSAEGASNQTAITLPEIKFTIDPARIATPAPGTIKLSLAESHAELSSDFNTPENWDSQGVKITVDGVTLDETHVTAVDAGTQGNNVIIIHTSENLEGDITIEGLKVWNLRDTHNDLKGTTAVNVEVQTATEFDSAPNQIAIYTAKGVELTGRATGYGYGASATRGYIEVDSEQKLFTDAISVQDTTDAIDNATSAPHRDVFDASLAAQELYLGELKLARGKNDVIGLEAGNEQGNKFQISGGDTLKLTLSSDVALNNYNLQLNSDSDCAAGTAESTAANNIYSNDGKTVEVKLNSGVDLDAGTPYYLCAVATGTERLEQVPSLRASVAVDYTNVRYGKSTGTVEYGAVLRNGCSVTLFNVPASNDADKAFIRFTNTSDKAGQVNASIWTQDGELIDSGALLLDSLAPHATAVLHTNAAFGTDGSTVSLADKMSQYADLSAGRHRIVINGGFPSCEALGLVRNGIGPLTNMTSTTNSSGTTAGTSNTTN